MNLTRTSNEFWDAKEEKTFISLDNAEPPPARSDKALMAMKGFFCWRHTNATAALSISIVVASNFEYKNSL